MFTVIQCRIFCLPVYFSSVKINMYRNVVLPVVLYGYETWSLTLREEHRLRVFESKVLRRIFGPNWDDVTGESKRLHHKELYALYFTPNIMHVIRSSRLRWAGHVARMVGRRGAYRVLVGNLRAGDNLEYLGVDISYRTLPLNQIMLS
jgi:hypothetical protein